MSDNIEENEAIGALKQSYLESSSHIIVNVHLLELIRNHKNDKAIKSLEGALEIDEAILVVNESIVSSDTKNNQGKKANNALKQYREKYQTSN